MPTFFLACRMALFAIQILATRLKKGNAEDGNSSFSLVIIVTLCAKLQILDKTEAFILLFYPNLGFSTQAGRWCGWRCPKKITAI